LRAWGFLTNHAHALIQIAQNPHSTVREVALATGITERATHAVLKDLRDAGIIIAQRNGRQNVYQVDAVALAKHPRWAASDMPIPKPLIEATLRGLVRVAAAGAAQRDNQANQA
jgi:DNA-binding transcriptional ArsR family regulator